MAVFRKTATSFEAVLRKTERRKTGEGRRAAFYGLPRASERAFMGKKKGIVAASVKREGELTAKAVEVLEGFGVYVVSNAGNERGTTGAADRELITVEGVFYIEFKGPSTPVQANQVVFANNANARTILAGLGPCAFVYRFEDGTGYARLESAEGFCIARLPCLTAATDVNEKRRAYSRLLFLLSWYTAHKAPLRSLFSTLNSVCSGAPAKWRQVLGGLSSVALDGIAYYPCSYQELLYVATVFGVTRFLHIEQGKPNSVERTFPNSYLSIQAKEDLFSVQAPGTNKLVEMTSFSSEAVAKHWTSLPIANALLDGLRVHVSESDMSVLFTAFEA